ncbi:50S ribosomal protein L29 [Patescibacteria group bacterium]|nr:50S ribosomal protein L29 [Patescibacteria group bacterium]MBU2633404.1 50S ribosomal protein L29 [Patescibacteria group bacterium]
MSKEKLDNKTLKELKAMLSEKRNALRDFCFRIAKGKAKDVKEGRVLRREIARILTNINKHGGK